MAGYRRSIGHPKGARTQRGFLRRARRPAGTTARGRASDAHRVNPRRLANQRLTETADPGGRLQIAAGYASSAARKYAVDPDAYERAVRQLLRLGDAAFARKRLPPAAIANARRNRHK